MKNRSLEAAAADARPGDVACDCCAGRKLKAFRSCLVCHVSYCELHLQPHYESPAFEKHKLVEPFKNVQENFCSRHQELMKLFCRSDQEAICVLCLMDEHKGHDTISAVTERKARQMELETSRTRIQQRIQNIERDVQVLQQEMEAINVSADEAVKDNERIFNELICLIDKKSCALKEQIRTQQKKEVSRVRELLEKMEQEITELQCKDAELEQLSRTHDHIHFLLNFPPLSFLSESEDSPRVNTRPLTHFEDVAKAVAEAQDKLQRILGDVWSEISLRVTEVDTLLPCPEPRTREEFIRYSRRITLDPNTANTWLSLSEGQRKATVMREQQSYSSHPDRFTDWLQVLSSESLTGRCYWEVERGSGGVSVAVAYKDICRTGDESGFGNNDESWALGCFDMTYYFRHNKRKTLLTGPQSSRIGVFLDHKAGTLSFYSICETMTLLHRVQASFSQPLHAGVWIYWEGDTAEFCELK